jgi:hypothetical protein
MHKERHARLSGHRGIVRNPRSMQQSAEVHVAARHSAEFMP